MCFILSNCNLYLYDGIVDVFSYTLALESVFVVLMYNDLVMDILVVVFFLSCSKYYCDIIFFFYSVIGKIGVN